MMRDEIMAMEAGPDLDWRIDELVMGLDVIGMLVVTPDHDSPGGYCVPYRQEMHKLDTLRPVYVAHCACDLDERQPGDEDYWGHYAACLEVSSRRSTDIAPAWEVVEKLTPHNFSFNVCIESPPHETGVWEATFLDNRLNTAYADTAPLAICRAALLAVMERDE